MKTVEEIVALRREFELALMDATHKAPARLLAEARELVETSDSRHTLVVPDNVEALSVDGGVWLPVMLYIGD